MWFCYVLMLAGSVGGYRHWCTVPTLPAYKAVSDEDHLTINWNVTEVRIGADPGLVLTGERPGEFCAAESTGVIPVAPEEFSSEATLRVRTACATHTPLSTFTVDTERTNACVGWPALAGATGFPATWTQNVLHGETTNRWKTMVTNVPQQTCGLIAANPFATSFPGTWCMPSGTDCEPVNVLLTADRTAIDLGSNLQLPVDECRLLRVDTTTYAQKVAFGVYFF